MQKDILETVDFERLCQDLGEELSYTLLKKFISSYEDYEDFLNLENEDLKKYIHKLKGASGNLRINKIFNLCISLEGETLDEDSVNHLKNLLKDSLENIEDFISNTDNTSTHLSQSEFAEFIKTLIQDLEEYNYIEDSRIETLCNSLENNKENISAIKKDFKSGDYETLIGRLKKL